MSPFALLVTLRVKDVTRRPGVAATFFGLPLLLLVTTAAVFAAGRPYERRDVGITGVPDDAVARLGEVPEVRLHPEASREGAVRKLRGGSLGAVVTADGGGLVVFAPSSSTLAGRGLVSILPGSRLSIVEVPRFAYVHYLFPGLLTWAIVVSGLFGMGYHMVHHRRTRFLKKLSVMPFPRFGFVAAEVVARSLLSLGQMALLVMAAVAGFGLRLEPAALPWLALLCLLGLLVFMGGGFALACIIDSEVAILDVSNGISVFLVLTSEIFFPADDLPAPLRAVAPHLPSTCLARLLRAVVLHGETAPQHLLPGAGVLALWAAGMLLLGWRSFRWYD